VPDSRTERLRVNGIAIDMVRRGEGRPLLFLHPDRGVEAEAAWLGRLAESWQVLAPSHPGFGQSELPGWFTSMDDLALFYLDLADQLDLKEALLVGVSFGGWIAAEIAVRSAARFSGLVLADALGIKVGDRETRDIVDFHGVPLKQLDALAWHDPAKAERDYGGMAEAELIGLARNREAFALYGWRPYMHRPQLRHWLHRIGLPTLVLWGESDRIVTPDYGSAYARLIPGARFETIAKAGHYPHLEQPDAFARAIEAFQGKRGGDRR
jgi:pimeloyl-ACP methyl ester carboxylesterase